MEWYFDSFQLSVSSFQFFRKYFREIYMDDVGIFADRSWGDRGRAVFAGRLGGTEVELFRGLFSVLINGGFRMSEFSTRVIRSIPLLFVFGVVLFIAGCANESANQAGNQKAAANQELHASAPTSTALKEGQATLGVPKIVSEEHHALHQELEAAIKAGGKTGEAAKLVEERLSPHFKREEEYAMPQLGLLVDLADGKVSADAKKAIELSDKLKAELPKMLEEHKGIVEALDALKKAATEEKSEVGLKFVETLSHHAVNEEQVMYPAAILVGEYLKLKTK